MTDRSKLLALAEAVAQAKGRDVPLNHEVATTLHGLGWHPADCMVDFTKSLDAAAMAVPKGMDWSAGTQPDLGDGKLGWGNVSPGGVAFPATAEINVEAATPTLALLSSALRAQAEALA